MTPREIVAAVGTECQPRLDEAKSALAQVERAELARVAAVKERVAAALESGDAAELREARADLVATQDQAEHRIAAAEKKSGETSAWHDNKQREALEKGFGKARWLAPIGRAAGRAIEETQDAAALLDGDRQVAEIRSTYGVALPQPSQIVREESAAQVTAYFANHRAWARHALELQAIGTTVAEERETVAREWQARLDAHTMPAPLPQLLRLIAANGGTIPEQYREAHDEWQAEHAAIEQQGAAAIDGVTAESLGLEIPAEPDCPRPEGDLEIWARVLGVEVEPPVPAHRALQRRERAWSELVDCARAAANEIVRERMLDTRLPQTGSALWREYERREQAAYDRVIREGIAAGILPPPPPPAPEVREVTTTVAHAYGASAPYSI